MSKITTTPNTYIKLWDTSTIQDILRLTITNVVGDSAKLSIIVTSEQLINNVLLPPKEDYIEYQRFITPGPSFIYNNIILNIGESLWVNCDKASLSIRCDSQFVTTPTGTSYVPNASVIQW